MIRISSSQTFDVTICGAGLAGICLARQLKLKDPNLNIVLVDRQKRPLDSGTHKVGESLIEVGANYLLNTLQLKDYLDRIHNPKCALRFYTRDGSLPLDQRTEFGTLDFPLIPAVQIDRGVFENDLRQMCIDMGIVLAEGVTVQDVELSSDGAPHQVIIEDELGQQSCVCSKWVVDALGRRRFLAQKLGLLQDVSHKASACWWRLPGQWEISDVVRTKESPGSTWHNREIGRRWFATNHLMGKGYWMWFIPVASHTSVGIVSDDRYHSIKDRSSPDKAMEWVRHHEPHVAAWLEGSEPSDFLALKDFAHTSRQFYSAERWALVGEAAMFADPYYSTGSDLIALQNNVVSRMILRDRNSELTEKHVSDYNDLVAEVFRGIHGMYDQQYSVFGNDYFQNLKVMWDFDFLLGAVGKLGFAPHVLDEVEKLPALTSMLKKWCDLNISTQKLIRDWCEIAPERTIERDESERKGPPGLISPGLPVFQNFNDQLRMRDAETLISDCEGSLLTYFQGRAVYLFQSALADLKTSGKYSTDQIEAIDKAMVAQDINPYAIDLDPNTWNEKGLFRDTLRFSMDSEQMEYIVPFQPEREEMLRMTPTPDEMFWMHVEQNPDEPAVVFGSSQLSYGQLGEKVAAACKELQSRGLTHGTVASIGAAGVETLVTFLSCLSSGAAYAAVPNSSEAAAVIRDVDARLVVAPEASVPSTVPVPLATYTELMHQEGLPIPPSRERTLSSRVRLGQFRYDEAENTPLIRPITAYSLTNLGVYQELALRQFLPIRSAEAVYPKLRVLTTSHAGQDWLVPLMFGGTLIIGAKGASGADLVGETIAVAERLGGQPILSGVPNRLMQVGAELKSRAALTFFSIDKPLSSDQSSRLSKICRAVVDGGIISWGHERHWTDEMKEKARYGARYWDRTDAASRRTGAASERAGARGAAE